MSERAGLEVGDRLFDHGVVAVVGLGLYQGERAVGEHAVVAPAVEQLALAGTAPWSGNSKRSRAARTSQRDTTRTDAKFERGTSA
jgi:hypothetical protein